MGRAARRPGARAPGARGRRLLLAALAAPGAGDEFHVVYEDDLMRLPPGATGSDLFGSAHFRLHVRRQMAGALALVEGMPSPWYAVADDLNVTSCEVMEDTNAAATRVDNGVVGGRRRGCSSTRRSPSSRIPSSPGCRAASCCRSPARRRGAASSSPRRTRGRRP
ncbi:unnamed protein product [Prorocentrum cordatum]|uniref:Uncharacterized protein n=1 Tax=Prorocentrum cordatum TaxID=2364126 RepID=A0ABN9QRH2_9DINO|nr:unnamed protein product [Polarella glacialis]